MTTPLRLAAAAAALLAPDLPAGPLASAGHPAPASPPAVAPSPAPDPSVGRPPPPHRLPMGPVQGPVSSPFGPRVHPVSGRVRHHDGVDLAVPAGTAVWTIAAGTVRSVGRRRGYGLVVEIDHPTGFREPVRTRYAHLASVDAAVRPGARVARGVALGASGGRPGRDGVSTGAHLHFEVRDADGRPLDPARFVRFPEATSTGPRWPGGAAPSPSASRPAPAPSEPTAATPDASTPEADRPGADLSPLVLPDYPPLTSITGTP